MQTSKLIFRVGASILAVILIAGCTKEARKARLLGEADAYFKAGNYDNAKLAYLNVIRLDPQNALAFERIGAMWQEDSAPLRAAAFLAKASELDPKNVENRTRLARCYAAVGRSADAKKEALKVLEQAPDNGDALIALTEAARNKKILRLPNNSSRNFQKRTTPLSTWPWRICLSMEAICLQRATRSCRRSQPILNRLLPTWRWEICI